MLFAQAQTAVLASINAKNGTFFKENDLLWGPGQAVEDLTPAPATAKNSSVLIRVNDGRPYSGQTRVFYDRQDFGIVMQHTPLNTYAKLRVFRPTTIHDLVPALNDYFGFNIGSADILDGPLDLVNGNGTAVIKANPRSLGWKGEFQVVIAPGDAKLENWLTDTDLAGIEYPSGQSEKGQAEVYSYRYDCSKFWEALRAIEVPDGGLLVTPALADLLVEVTGDTWTFEPGDYSFVGALVTYNGANSSDKKSNPAYTSIIQIELGPQCDNLAGVLTFHYNTDSNINTNATNFTIDGNLNNLAMYDPRVGGYVDYTFDRSSIYYYTSEHDYTPVASLLSGIPWQSQWYAATVANCQKIRDALNALDGRGWVTNTTATVDYNTYGAYVRYNGPVAAAPESATLMPMDELLAKGKTHVMILQLPFQWQSNLWFGQAYLFYNA